jgi:Rieske 2Fe-2S family protein
MGHQDSLQINKPIEAASHAPKYVYASQAFFELEKKNVFLKEWLLVARVEEVASPGDYMTTSILGEPVVVCRDKKGKLGAVINACIHRGAAVASGAGNAKAFVCPYHGWTYDLSGRLKGAPGMEGIEGFDPSKCGLREVALSEWAGNIFICFDVNPPSFTDFIAEFEKDFGFLRLGDLCLGGKRERIVNCNWKLVVENLMDFYHVPVLHENTLAKTGFEWAHDKGTSLKKDGGYSVFYKSAPNVFGGKSLYKPIPWLEERGESFASLGIRPPNLLLFGRSDSVRPIVLWPVSLTQCRWVSYNLYPPETLLDPELREKEKRYSEWQDAVLGEDLTMIDSLQTSLASDLFVPGRMSLMEKPAHNFLNAHIRRVLGNRDPAEFKG